MAQSASVEKLLHPELSIIPFERWRRGIAPLWAKESFPESIYSFLNAYGQMQYVGQELFTRVLVFPIVAEINGQPVGWTSCYNISDQAIRIRGIYVLPEFRNRGIGRALVNYAIGLWPQPWDRCFMIARASNVERYADHWGFSTYPGFSLRSFSRGAVLGEKRVVMMYKKINAHAECGFSLATA